MNESHPPQDAFDEALERALRARARQVPAPDLTVRRVLTAVCADAAAQASAGTAEAAPAGAVGRVAARVQGRRVRRAGTAPAARGGRATARAPSWVMAGGVWLLVGVVAVVAGATARHALAGAALGMARACADAAFHVTAWLRASELDGTTVVVAYAAATLGVLAATAAVTVRALRPGD